MAGSTMGEVTDYEEGEDGDWKQEETQYLWSHDQLLVLCSGTGRDAYGTRSK